MPLAIYGLIDVGPVLHIPCDYSDWAQSPTSTICRRGPNSKHAEQQVSPGLLIHWLPLFYFGTETVQSMQARRLSVSMVSSDRLESRRCEPGPQMTGYETYTYMQLNEKYRTEALRLL